MLQLQALLRQPNPRVLCVCCRMGDLFAGGRQARQREAFPVEFGLILPPSPELQTILPCHAPPEGPRVFLPLLKARRFVPVPFLPALVVAVRVPWAAGGERLEGRIRQEKGLLPACTRLAPFGKGWDRPRPRSHLQSCRF